MQRPDISATGADHPLDHAMAPLASSDGPPAHDGVEIEKKWGEKKAGKGCARDLGFALAAG
jgi:hypothetical protein